MIRAIVALSGGMDSATTLKAALSNRPGDTVHLAVGFDYGSKHGKYEVECAVALAHHYKVPYRLIALSHVFEGFKSNLLKTGGDIPEGHYESESMKQTVVPGRNIIFASILAGLAMSEECTHVYLGIHAGDHHIYPDCRPNFFHAMNEAVRFGTDNQVDLSAPFLHDTKADILRYGLSVGVPYHLTRTCYKNQPTACGKCGSCVERREAFQKNGAVDPIAYEPH